MLREVGLTLLCLAAIAAPAEAGDRGPTPAHGTRAAQERMAAATGQEHAQMRHEPARSGIVPSARSAVRSEAAGSFRRNVINRPIRSVALLSQISARQGGPRDQQRPGLALSLTERLRVGLDYRHLEGEDLWPEFADTGAAGYDSHHVLIQASWRF